VNEVLSLKIPKPSLKVAYMRMINYYSLANVGGRANNGLLDC
jgi:hypothetical protein